MSTRQRNRPRGWVRHYAGLIGPNALVGARLAFERDRGGRVRRVASTLGDHTKPSRGRRPRMRSLLALPGGRLQWREVATPPSPAPGAAIVHPIACATCDLDCPLALGALPFPLPLHLGHECVAEVLTIGEQVTSIRPGDRVIVPFQISCGTCEACRAGKTGSCLAVPPFSMYGMGLTGGQWGGAFSDQLAVPFADAMLVPLPPGVDPIDAASVSDNICDAYRHVAPHLPSVLDRDPDAQVLILVSVKRRSIFSCSGPLYAGLFARALGARNIALADARPWVRDHAAELGFEPVHPRELRRRPPAPLVIDMSVDHLGVALASTAADGICTAVAALHRGTRIPAMQMYLRNTTLHLGRTHVRTLIPQVLQLMVDGRFNPAAIPTNVALLDHAPVVLTEHILRGEIKTILTV